MFRYILVFLLLILPVHANIHYDSLKTFLTKKYFTLTNSVTLNIPFKYAPKFIYDFAISKNYIYMLSESDHPILQFKKNGQFIGSIGKKGNGPEEFMFTPVKIAANKYNDQFIAIDGPGGISLYHYIPGKKIKKYTNTSYFGFVDIEIFKNLPVIVCSSESKKHIKFLGKDFTINESYIDVPVESKILASVSTSFWGIQKNGNQSFLSNVSYPFHIFQSQILKKNNSLEYSKLPVSNNILPDFKAPPYKEEYSIKEYKKIFTSKMVNRK